MDIKFDSLFNRFECFMVSQGDDLPVFIETGLVAWKFEEVLLEISRNIDAFIREDWETCDMEPGDQVAIGNTLYDQIVQEYLDAASTRAA